MNLYLHLLSDSELAAERKAADLAWRGIQRRPFLQHGKWPELPKAEPEQSGGRAISIQFLPNV